MAGDTEFAKPTGNSFARALNFYHANHVLTSVDREDGPKTLLILMKLFWSKISSNSQKHQKLLSTIISIPEHIGASLGVSTGESVLGLLLQHFNFDILAPFALMKNKVTQSVKSRNYFLRSKILKIESF